MAAALFATHVENLAEPTEVSSAGISIPGTELVRDVPPEVIEVMVPYGINLEGHRSRTLTEPMLKEADLVIGMGRRHVQEAILLDPLCWPKAFRLKELVRRGELVGPRRPDQGIRSWIDAVHGDRTRSSLAHRSTVDDVADPYGGTLDQYRSTAAELAQLVGHLAALLWPAGNASPSGRDQFRSS
jgi:protein-tyrosine-phosphatase